MMILSLFCKGFTDSLIVSEPVALELRQRNGDIYLHAQIFTGLMYMAAAVCMWFLRAWKIGQLEETATGLEKRPGDLNTAMSQPTGPQDLSLASKNSPSSIIRRLMTWKKV